MLQAQAEPFQDKTSLLEHPPSNLTPLEDNSKPDTLEVVSVVPELSGFIAISLALTVIPLPAPISRLTVPTVPPPVNPAPAVIAVVANDDTLFESSNVPVLPLNKFISVPVEII